jgi:hypothetical protein
MKIDVSHIRNKQPGDRIGTFATSKKNKLLSEILTIYYIDSVKNLIYDWKCHQYKKAVV